MKLQYPILIFFMIPLAGFSQIKPHKLVGAWIEKSINGNKFIECPYQIHFEKNYKYRLLNVCYGLDPKLPITEDGNWIYDSVKNVIILNNRNVHDNNNHFHNSDSVLNIHIKEHKTSSITIYFNSEKNQTLLLKMK